MSKHNSKFYAQQSSPTEVAIFWTAGDCPTQDEVRDHLNSTGRGHLKPMLVFDPKVTGFPFGKTLFAVKYTKKDLVLSNEIYDMGVTAVYEWFLFDRYRHIHICSLTPSYECHLLYTTYDVTSKYQNQTAGYIKAFPEEARKEELEWERLRDRIEDWLAQAWAETEQVQYFNTNVKNREEFWPESIPYTEEMDKEEREKCYNEFLEKELENERCNPSKG
jgi:hypothetical protein